MSLLRLVLVLGLVLEVASLRKGFLVFVTTEDNEKPHAGVLVSLTWVMIGGLITPVFARSNWMKDLSRQKYLLQIGGQTRASAKLAFAIGYESEEGYPDITLAQTDEPFVKVPKLVEPIVMNTGGLLEKCTVFSWESKDGRYTEREDVVTTFPFDFCKRKYEIVTVSSQMCVINPAAPHYKSMSGSPLVCDKYLTGMKFLTTFYEEKGGNVEIFSRVSEFSSFFKYYVRDLPHTARLNSRYEDELVTGSRGMYLSPGRTSGIQGACLQQEVLLSSLAILPLRFWN